jgi:hypothetical protein
MGASNGRPPNIVLVHGGWADGSCWSDVIRLDGLGQDAAIIRNRAKIQATVNNARAMMSATRASKRSRSPMRSTARTRPLDLRPTHIDPQAEALAKQLKVQGYRFIGPTSTYAFIRNLATERLRSSARSSRHAALLSKPLKDQGAACRRRSARLARPALRRWGGAGLGRRPGGAIG